MQNAAGDGVALAAYDQNATYRAVISDLVSLVDHVQKSLRLIEQTIARETSLEMTPGSPQSSTNIIVLDDISPRYIKADAALQACDVNLGTALRSLLDSSDSDPCAASLRASGHRGVRPTRRRPAGAYDVPPPQIFPRIFSRGQPPAAIAVWRPACHRAPPSPDAATTMEKLDAALNNMSHGLCMFGPDNRLLLWNDRYVKMYRLAPDCLRVGCTLDEMLEALRWNRTRRLNFWCDAFS